MPLPAVVPPVRAVLFDMDGVLVFSEDAWFAVYNRTLASFGHPEVSREAFDAIYGNGTEADRDTYMPERTVAEVNDAYARFFEESLGAVRPNASARDVLLELRRRGVRTACATNTMSRLARRILGLAELLDALDAVASADEAGAGKPDPAVVLLAAARAGVPPGEALFVGDSRYDEEAAARAGVRFAGFRRASPERVDELEALLALPGLPLPNPAPRP